MIIRKQSGWNSGSADNDGRALRLSIVRGYALFFFIRRVVRRYVGYRQLTAECRVERYNAFAPCKTKGLELVVDDVEQMMIVQSVYFDEHVIVAGGVVTFNNFRYLLQNGKRIVEIFGILEVQTYVGACFIAYFFRVYDELRTFENTLIAEFLDTLVYGCAAYIASTCHFEKRDTGIFGNEPENFLVQ